MDETYFTLRFVLPQGKTEATCSELLSEAYEKCRDHDIKPAWINHDDVLDLSPVKQDVFVMDPFDGEAFSFLTRFKCTIVGPRCLLSCLAESVPVPELPYPMYTAALRGCVVTSTGFSREKKAELQLRIERMGGIYANAFHDGVTHLIAEVVKSQKYEVAIRKEIPIFTDEWVDKIWELGKHENVKADDKRFIRYSCPAFKGLAICVSQMARRDKDTLRKRIETHGGIYSPVLDMEKTAILITPTSNGDKYEYARKWQIPCVSPEWVMDSIDRGCCLSTSKYRVDAARASTPTKEDMESSKAGGGGKLEDLSMCSVIVKPGAKGPADETMTRKVDESVNPLMTTNLSLMGVSDKNSGSAEQIVKLESERGKRAGLYLDECFIFLSGFPSSQVERLEKVLLAAGASFMKQITPSLTHFIVGDDVVAEHFDLLKKLGATPYKVTLQWVVDSMQRGRPAPEEDCAFDEEVKANTSKKKRPSTNATVMAPPPNRPRMLDEEKEDAADYEENLLMQYSNKSSKAAKATSSDADETVQFKDPSDPVVDQDKTEAPTESATMAEEGESQFSRFLTDKKLMLIGFGEDAESDLSECVNEVGGEFVFRDFKGVLDYIVVPFASESNLADNLDFKALEVVTDFWLEDCLEAGSLLPVQYYHRPITVDRSLQPCSGAVIGITNYVGRERQFITGLAEALGAIAQEIFAKRDKRGAKQSTHLVCAKAEGAKYEAAIKWRLPVITKDWLLACRKDLAWVSEKSFLVGESTAFTEGKPEPSGEAESVSEIELNDVDEAPVKDVTKEDEGCGNATVTPKTTRPDSKKQLSLETPGPDSLNIDKLRPSRLRELRPPSMDMDLPPDSQPSPSQRTLKRKRQEGDDNMPYYLDGAKTPDTPYGVFLGGGDPTPRTRKIWKRRVDELAKFEMTDDERAEVKGKIERVKRAEQAPAERQEKEREKMRAEFEEHEKRFLDSNKAVKERQEVLNRLGVEEAAVDKATFDELMEKKYNKSGRSWKNLKRKAEDDSGADSECPDFKKPRAKQSVYNTSIMKGVVICVAKKLRSMQDDICGIVASLGGEYRLQYGPEVTHLVFSSSKVNDVTKDFRQAKKDGKRVVCPDWVTMSRDEGRLLEEEAFPHTFNPRMNLSISVSGGSSPNTRRSSARKKGNDTTIKDTPRRGDSCSIDSSKQVLDCDEKEKSAPNDEDSEAEAQLQQVSANMEKMEKLATSAKRNRSSGGMRLTLTSTDGSPRGNNGAEVDEDDGDICTPPSQVPDGDSQVIQWKDPKEEVERKILQEKLALETQVLTEAARKSESECQFESLEIPDNLTAAMEEDEKENSQQGGDESSSPTLDIRFMVSNVSDQERQKFTAFLDTIGIQHSSLNSCDPAATHIVAQKLTRSEKMLGSIASGKWVLHPTFMATSMRSGKLSDFAPFEWGNPDNGFLDPKMSDLEKSLAAASYRTRRKREEGRGGKGRETGVFAGFRAIVHTSESRVDAFRRLIELGGGKVIQACPPYSNPGEATHMLAEPSRLPGVKLDYRALAAAGVAVVTPLYLNEFLVTDPPPKVDRFVIEEFRSFWKNRLKQQ